MAIEIKTASIEPIRHTFSNVARRQGADKPASRYLEAMYDLQPTVNFHYKPLWDPDHELYDTGRTAINMEDWYVFRDPRQFYYGSWTIARSKQQEVAERNYAFVEKKNLLDLVSAEAKERAEAVFVPLRHAEYAANLNNMYICAYGYGTAITQAASFNAVDRLGIAQYLSRIGLMLDGNTCESLDGGKQAWLEGETWQPLRRLTEDLMVTRDWFELFVAQNFALDGLAFPLVYERIDRRAAEGRRLDDLHAQRVHERVVRRYQPLGGCGAQDRGRRVRCQQGADRAVGPALAGSRQRGPAAGGRRGLRRPRRRGDRGAPRRARHPGQEEGRAGYRVNRNRTPVRGGGGGGRDRLRPWMAAVEPTGRYSRRVASAGSGGPHPG
ncbi:MAG: hypothetical protein U5L11_03820 [Arhodomonas sp.]|nr:hypothetical protein [Arhodomonas sp.]